jgi:predicted O-linked N-acetylglucosamine transferase (SPINDLY family)
MATSPANLLNEAISHHRMGNLAQAAKLYQRVLRSTPAESNALKLLGIIELQTGNLGAAERLLTSAVKSNSDSADCHYYLGRVLLLKEDPRRARSHFERAVALDGRHRDALTCLGILLQKSNRTLDALDHFDRVLRLDSGVLEALLGRGNCLIDLGRHADAALAFDRALSINPSLADAWLGRGNALRRLKSHDACLAAYQKALAIDPHLAQALIGWGHALADHKQYDEALYAYDQALSIKPRNAEIRTARGDFFFARKQYQEAKSEYEGALSINQDFAPAHVGLGNVSAMLHRYDEALSAFGQALSINADCVEAHLGRAGTLLLRKDFGGAASSYDKVLAMRPDHRAALLGRCDALYGLGQYDEQTYAKALALDVEHGDAAERAAWLYDRSMLLLRVHRVRDAIPGLRQAIAIDPDTRLALGHLVNARMRLCDWELLDADLDHLLIAVQAGKWVCEPFSLLATPADAADQLRCAKTNVAKQEAPIAVDPDGQTRPSSDHERLRVAYVSADFREHPVAFLMAGLFERHDRARFETFAVSLHRDDSSEMQKRLKGAFDRFLDVSEMGDDEVTALLQAHEIDIAVDLMGYTQRARPGVFARRAAPIQVGYLGYQGTSGAEYMDYVIADPVVLPFDQQACYTEKIVHLPDCYMVNDASRPISSQACEREQEGLPGTGFVFCCFNQSYKISPAVFDIWMRLLAGAAGSVLWLSARDVVATGNLRSEAQARGIDPARIIFARRLTSMAEHLARQRLADLFLDTLPYNAHSTASDALWAGLPVLTCLGSTFAGRAAASLLHAVGLPELVCDNLQEYEALALKLALAPAELTAIRRKLEANRLTYPLFNTDRFRRHIEAAYRTMWEIRQRNEPLRHFSVAPERTLV